LEFAFKPGIIASWCSKSANAILFFLHVAEIRWRASGGELPLVFFTQPLILAASIQPMLPSWRR